MFTPTDIPLGGYDPPATEKFLPKTAPYTPKSTLPPLVAQPSQQYSHDQYTQQSNYQSQSQSNFYPSSSNKVGNVSPTPFGSGSSPSQQYRGPQQGYSPKPALPSPVNQSVPWANGGRKPNAQYNNTSSPVPFGPSPTITVTKDSYPTSQTLKPHYGGQSNGQGSHYGSLPSNYSPSYIQSAPVSPRASRDYTSCKNYNTAARGWTQMQDYYQPIHQANKQHKTALPFTDF